ncbi:MAG: hypothetical protein ACTHLY_08665 [Pseudolabrys sp.]
MQNKIAEEVQRSLDKLRADIDTLELWLGALEGASQPLPDYESPFRRTRIPAKDVEFRGADRRA